MMAKLLKGVASDSNGKMSESTTEFGNSSWTQPESSMSNKEHSENNFVNLPAKEMTFEPKPTVAQPSKKR